MTEVRAYAGRRCRRWQFNKQWVAENHVTHVMQNGFCITSADGMRATIFPPHRVDRVEVQVLSPDSEEND